MSVGVQNPQRAIPPAGNGVLTEKDFTDDELGLVKFKLKALPTGENCSQRLVIRLQKPKKSFVINGIKRRVAFSPVFDNSGSDESNAPFCAVELNSKWIVLSSLLRFLVFLI